LYEKLKFSGKRKEKSYFNALVYERFKGKIVYYKEHRKVLSGEKILGERAINSISYNRHNPR
jgi:hypothetical protein